MIINAIGSNIVPKNRMKAKTSKMNSLPADLSSYNSQKFEKSMARDTFVSSSNAMQNNKKAKDVSFTGRYVNRQLVAENYTVPSSSGSTCMKKVYQESYKPYCWEEFEYRTGNPEYREDCWGGILYSPSKGVQQTDYYSPSPTCEYTINHPLLPAYNREESLKCEIEDISNRNLLKYDIDDMDYRYFLEEYDEDSRHKDPNVDGYIGYYTENIQKIVNLEAKEKENRKKGDDYMKTSKEESTKFFDFLTGKSASSAAEAERYYSLADEAKKQKEDIKNTLKESQKEAKDKVKWLQGEVDALADARWSGNLVDISVTNKYRPTSQLEDFLEKECKKAKDETETYKMDWVGKKLLALPNATMHVADAILIALGISKASAFDMSSVQKKYFIAPYMKDSDFVNKVLDGVKKIT